MGAVEGMPAGATGPGVDGAMPVGTGGGAVGRGIVFSTRFAASDGIPQYMFAESSRILYYVLTP